MEREGSFRRRKQFKKGANNTKSKATKKLRERLGITMPTIKVTPPDEEDDFQANPQIKNWSSAGISLTANLQRNSYTYSQLIYNLQELPTGRKAKKISGIETPTKKLRSIPKLSQRRTGPENSRERFGVRSVVYQSPHETDFFIHSRKPLTVYIEQSFLLGNQNNANSEEARAQRPIQALLMQRDIKPCLKLGLLKLPEPVFLQTKNQEIMLVEVNKDDYNRPIKSNKKQRFLLINPKNRKVTLRSQIDLHSLDKRIEEDLKKLKRSIKEEEFKVDGILNKTTYDNYEEDVEKIEINHVKMEGSALKESGFRRFEDYTSVALWWTTHYYIYRSKDGILRRKNAERNPGKVKRKFRQLKSMEDNLDSLLPPASPRDDLMEEQRLERLSNQLGSDLHHFSIKNEESTRDYLDGGKIYLPKGCYTVVKYYNFGRRELDGGWISDRYGDLDLRNVQKEVDLGGLKKSKILNVKASSVDFLSILSPDAEMRVFCKKTNKLIGQKNLKILIEKTATETSQIEEKEDKLGENRPKKWLKAATPPFQLNFGSLNDIVDFSNGSVLVGKSVNKMRTKSFKIQEEDYFLLLNKPYLLLLKFRPLELVSYCYLDRDVGDLNSVKDIVKKVHEDGKVTVLVDFDYFMIKHLFLS